MILISIVSLQLFSHYVSGDSDKIRADEGCARTPKSHGEFAPRKAVHIFSFPPFLSPSLPLLFPSHVCFKMKYFWLYVIMMLLVLLLCPFHQYFMSCFCACKFKMLFMSYGIEQRFSTWGTWEISRVCLIFINLKFTKRFQVKKP